MADLSDVIDTLIAEGYAEGPEGMRRIAETIINRSAVRNMSLADVVRQPAQYTGFARPGPAAVKAQRDPTARAAAEAALQLALEPGDPTGGADHYHADYVNPDWANSLPKTGSYKNHVFYASRPIPPASLNRAVATALDVVPARFSQAAPTPFAPPARGNVPSDLISRSMASNSAAQSRSSLANMFGSSVNRSTPRLTASGGITNPASSLTDWASSLPTTRRVVDTAPLTRAGAVDSVHSGLSQDSALQAALRQSINDQGTVVARIPTSRSAPAMPTGFAQSYAGQDRVPVRARLPTIAASTIGQPPTIRTVASVPVSGSRITASRMDPVDTMPTAAAFASMFRTTPSASGTTSANKAQDRLPTTAGPKANASAPGPALLGGLDPTVIRAPGVPVTRGAQAAPEPTYRTVTERVVNPAWTAAQQEARIDPVGDMPTWGEFASTFAPKPAAPKPMPPQYITVSKKVAIAPVARRIAPVPVQRPVAAARAPLEVTVNGANVVRPSKSGGNTSAVQRLRDQGYSPAQAYEMANRQASDRARAGASNPVSSFHERATSSSGMWSAHD